MKMRILASLSLALMIPQFASAQATTQQDENVVQRTYARLAFATEVKGVEESQATSQDQLKTELAGKVLQIQITSMTGGPISEILDTPVVSLVTMTGDVMAVSPGSTVNSNVDTKVQVSEQGAAARWVASPGAFEHQSSALFKEALPETLPSANRYIQASVIATLAGQSRSYNSLFLFDAKGNVSAIDLIVGSSALSYFVLKPVYPHILMETSFYTSNSITRAWLATKQIATCSSEGKSECCDLPTVRCGVSQSDLTNLNATVTAASTAKLTVTPNDGTPERVGRP